MTAVIDEQTQFVDISGAPVVGGLLYFGVAGSDPKLNPTPIFSDRGLTVALANPQTTNSLGRSTNKVWIPGKYSFRLSDSADVQIYQELDNGTTSAGIAALLITSVVGANTITGAASSAITAYVDGQQFNFKTVSVNTGAVTLNIDSVGAKSIVKNFNKAILPGDFAANQIIIVVYNSTSDNFDWVNQKRLSNTFYEGSAVVAAATTDVWAVDGDTIHITGTTGITSLGTAPNVGARKTLIFDGIVTLTNSANLALPGGANFTTAAGDVLEVYADTVTQIDVRVSKKDGTEAVGSGLLSAELFHVRDEKASGVAGGGFTAGSFVKRTLNTTLTNEITGATLTASVIALPTGTYFVRARSPGNRVRGHKAKLVNTSDTVDEIIGSSEEAESVDFVSTNSMVVGRLTVASGPKNYELQHQCNSTRATDGLGHPVAVGVVEVFAEVEIWKVA